MKKEIDSFFNSLIAYIVLIIFLTGVGLFFWVFGDTVLVSWEGRMDALFYYAPIFFLFLIPAITMRSFSEELRAGTIELLATKPITDWQIIMGKYLASVFLVTLALVPTLIYYFFLQSMTIPAGNLDTGPIWGAYIGLLGLGAIFSAIGIFCSSISRNQVVAFVLSAFFCFFFYFGFTFLAELEVFEGINAGLAKIGIEAHYESISLGVVDTRDIVYYLGFILIVLLLTRAVLILKKK